MGCLRLIIFAMVIVQLKANLKDYDFESDPDEVMIAQESRHYHTVVQPPVRIVKPSGVTNSHRPQYNLDSYEGGFEDFFEATSPRSVVKNYKSSNNIRSKEGAVKDVVLKALERKDHVGKFAQILPIVRAMSGSQRVALASLVASQVSTPPGRTPLNLTQVRSMFGNNVNASAELMLPILLDMANLIRRAVRSGKEPREVRQPQILRRSFTEDQDSITDEPFDTSTQPTTQATKIRNRRIIPQRTVPPKSNTPMQENKTDINVTSLASDNTLQDDKNITKPSTSSTTEVTSTSSSVTSSRSGSNVSRALTDNATLDLMADSTNQTLAQDLPVAEKLRLSLNRYIDRNGNPIRRGTYPPKPSSVLRRTTAEPTLSSIRRRPPPARKLPTASADKATCELFTNSLCLHADDYPTEAIVQSIRRNKAAAGALLADFRDPVEGAVDGVSAAQEEQYTAEHYLVSNRRGDTLNRDFASAGEAGFMCPSTVKYARPQRARATSGQWKYIVNTGEHTQTLRLEKCLKPKEACTYLTDNFKSKCVQVYNYHRLLTWDQQNGLHMDIFKVPTCCSCHIEGYSVSFPPLGHRVHETSSEHFPGEDISAEQGNNAFEAVQSTVPRPNLNKNPPFTHAKPLETFPPFSDSQNQITGTLFNSAKFNDNEESILSSNTADSFGNHYFPDSFNQASSIRNIKRPPSGRSPVGNSFDSVTLPSYLEPPTPEASSSFNFVKELPSKIKNAGSPFKRGALRPSRRPMRKKITGGPDDLVSSGTSVLESFTSSSVESPDEFNEYSEEPDIGQASNPPKTRITIAPKLHAASAEISTTPKTKEKNRSNHSYMSNGKRINYNYHPIIDFFGEEEKEDEEATDREDIEPSYIPTVESEWKPINNPPNRNIQNGNVLERKKHK